MSSTKLTTKSCVIAGVVYRLKSKRGWLNWPFTHCHTRHCGVSLSLPVCFLYRDILHRGWDYVALGDWHIHRYQPLKDVPAFYAGSLEALTFGEAVAYPPRGNDNYTIHGAIDVHLSLDKPAKVHTFANREARPVLRLEAIDATKADADTLMDMLRTRLHAELPSHAIALLEIKNVLPQVWQQLDHAEIAERRKFVRRCEIRPSLDRK